LLLLGVSVPLLREAAPRTRYFDSNRHFIEYVPVLCALAGAGANGLATALRAVAERFRVSRRTTSASLALAGAVALGCLVWPVAEYHPYEVTYFNSLVGGLGGAQRLPVFVEQTKDGPRPMGGEGDYWYSTTREAIALAKPYLPEKHLLGSCGPYGSQLDMNRGDVPLVATIEHRNTRAFDPTAVVYAVPHPSLCNWSSIRALEHDRPILHRVERGGGLIYELLGRRDGKEHPVVTPKNPE
jgi:hypothetical protein